MNTKTNETGAAGGGQVDAVVKLPIPQELIDLWDEHLAAEAARADAVKGFFKFQLRNAIYFGRVAIQKKREFWRKCEELYPELGNDMQYWEKEGALSRYSRKAV